MTKQDSKIELLGGHILLPAKHMMQFRRKCPIMASKGGADEIPKMGSTHQSKDRS